MAAYALDWPSLLDGRTAQQWLLALGHPAAATDDQHLLAVILAGIAPQLERLPPGWYVWRGVAAKRPWYARRPGSSPPLVVWGWTLEQVAARAAGG